MDYSDAPDRASLLKHSHNSLFFLSPFRFASFGHHLLTLMTGLGEKKPLFVLVCDSEDHELQNCSCPESYFFTRENHCRCEMNTCKP